MFIVKYKKIFIFLSLSMVALSLVFIFVFGLKLGIEFKGGALSELNYPQGRPEVSQVEEELKSLNLGEFVVQPTGERGYILKTRDLTESEHQTLLGRLSLPGYTAEEVSFTSIGPSVGSELKQKAIISNSALLW